MPRRATLFTSGFYKGFIGQAILYFLQPNVYLKGEYKKLCYFNSFQFLPLNLQLTDTFQINTLVSIIQRAIST